jgi:hypothetical protein
MVLPKLDKRQQTLKIDNIKDHSSQKIWFQTSVATVFQVLFEFSTMYRHGAA